MPSMTADESQLHDNVDRVSLDEILPYGENPKKHPEEQVEKIASSIRRFGFDQPIVVDGGGTIIKGHGRYQAAKRLGLEYVPVIRQTDLSEAEARAARIADNRVAESEWDDDLLTSEIEVLDAQDTDLDLDILGFDNDELDDLLPDEDDVLGADEEQKYTDKIKSPVYEPTGPQPALADLYSEGRFQDLLDAVNAADIPEDLRNFLRLAAHRHIVFDYENIAEYYAHADPEVQDLMEALTLVIIDYEQAIEQGFVNFATETLEGEANE